MTIRKRRQPTPHFKLPPPYSPVTGETAPLSGQGVFPYVAMMQVAEVDTHQNYVICRGHDIRFNKFYDYQIGTIHVGIPVAKPYGARRVGVYTVGQIFPAILPMQSFNPQPASVLWRVGKNPGVATVSDGHPADLSEEVSELYTDGGVLIDWMLLEGDSNYMMVRATECILPGAGGLVQPQQWNAVTKCWEDSAFLPFLIIDPSGWLLALVNDCFRVDRQQGVDYTPSFPFGLTRRVKITEEIGCNSCGQVTLLPGIEGCPTETISSEATDCKITACNGSGRALGCDADEYAILHVQPGTCCSVAPACYGWLVANPRAMRARAILGDSMCGSAATLGVFDPDGWDVCSWVTREPIESAKNPYHLYGCAGDWVELAWVESTCSWEVIQVSHHEADPPLQDIFCSDCGVSGTRLKHSMAIQQCLECGETEDVALLTGVEFDVVEDLNVACDEECANGTIIYKRVCMLCTPTAPAKDAKIIPTVTVDVLTSFGKVSTEDSEGNMLTCGLTAVKKTYCLFGCSVGEAGADGVSFAKVDPVSEAVFDCETCPSLQVSTLGVFVLCVDESETVYEPMECVCDPCEEESA